MHYDLFCFVLLQSVTVIELCGSVTSRCSILVFYACVLFLCATPACVTVF